MPLIMWVKYKYWKRRVSRCLRKENCGMHCTECIVPENPYIAIKDYFFNKMCLIKRGENR